MTNHRSVYSPTKEGLAGEVGILHVVGPNSKMSHETALSLPLGPALLEIYWNVALLLPISCTASTFWKTEEY